MIKHKSFLFCLLGHTFFELSSLSQDRIKLIPQIVANIVRKFHLPDSEIALDSSKQLLGDVVVHRIEPDIILQDGLVLVHEKNQLIPQQFSRCLFLLRVIQKFYSRVSDI